MIDVSRGLEPLGEAGPAIKKLQDYQSAAELASAVQATHAAVQRSLRYLLRADKGAPDELRMIALTPSELAPDRLIPALRQRDLISLDLAGQIHELEQSALRAERGSVRAGDADLALHVVDQLQSEIKALADRPVREAAHHAVETGALTDVQPVPLSQPSRSRTRSISIAAAVLFLVMASWLIFFRKSGTEKGIAQFESGQFERAEQTLSKVVEDDPSDPRAAYYLAIMYRRTQRNEQASSVLRRAIEKNPKDVYLREELGNLFMTLDRPDLAAKQFRIAQEQEPDNPRYWIKLVSALRAAGDPAAEETLQRAPAEARAMLRTAQ